MKRSPNIVRRKHFSEPDREGLGLKRRNSVPHEFVLEALSSISPWTRPMFGCLAVYVAEKIVLILRDKPDHPSDNGVWLATTAEHHESLRREFPSMQSIAVLGKGVTGWQILPADAEDFEELALRACELVLRGDPRIGKVPGARRSKSREIRKARKPAKPVAKTGRAEPPRSRK